MTKVTPVILSGGSGTRLWPLSREAFPKQFLPLVGDRTLLQETALRAGDRSRFAAPVVIASADHRFIVAEQLRAVGIVDAAIILEPAARNTGPAAVVAALAAGEGNAEALVLLMPADHAIADAEGFQAVVEAGRAAAEAGEIVLFGMPATRPETGYGYISAGEPLGSASAVRRILRFVEKPERATAEDYCRQGFLWNGGIFLFSARRMLAEFERFEPEMLRHVRESFTGSVGDLDFLRLAPEPFAAAKSISIDKAVMERTRHAVVIPAAIGWSDIGAWSALWEISPKDAQSNVCIGDVHVAGATGSYLRSEGPALAVVGVQDLVVIAAPDAVLVAGPGAQQDLAAMVAELRAGRHPAAVSTAQVHRPWGSSRLLHQDARSQVRRMTIAPGASLTRHRHEQRAEHWTVLAGTAHVTVGDEERALGENESAGIPIGTVHVLANRGDLPLDIIEIQSGTSFGEDDIVPA